MTTLKLEHVHKSYGDLHAVNDLSLSVNEGQIFGLLGPNGAGKTTTIRMIMDIIKPDAGRIEILGEHNPKKIRDRIGYLPEERGLYKKMLVREVIQFFAEIKGVTKSVVQDKAYDWLERLDLIEWKEKKVEELSRGMQQKLQFICTLLHEPRVIILDEPFTGLDPVNTDVMKDVILDQKKNGATIIFSTHLMDQVEKMCEAICLINKGIAVLQGSLSEVKSRFGKNRVKLQFEGKADFLNDSALVASYDEYNQYVELTPAAGVKPNQLLERAIQTATVQRFEISEPSLNEIFKTMVKKGDEA
ncbi:ATP-binding cassette domain-containing protein [candidate division KSB1 bacterium]|nr:ATP-binding cassette domain-containing protein [candidate division KSB1 bacterium]RQW01267.1 MAG: ATP-binding cassette domain-containing protein [candidate division KSB1 bacterium]